MKKYFLIISLFLWGGTLTAQNFNHYTLLKNDGDLPDQMTRQDTVITWDHVDHTSKVDSKEDAQNKLDYIKYANFFIKYLLQSGQLMYGTALNEYADNVLNRILQTHPEHQNVFTIYITRYPEVNAACLPNGILLINIGLIAQLENEAQLAFIIAHEIIHYINKHGIESYIELQKTMSQRNSARSEEDRVFAMLNYQKDLEFEADELGFRDYFSKSEYKLGEAEAVCDVLLYSDFPVDEIEFTKDLINDEYFIIPSKNWKDTIDIITAIEDYDDEKLTHPNIKKRRARIRGILQSYNNNGYEFIQDREQFYLIRDIARFELLNIFLSEKKYADAIYLTHVLSQKYPDSDYLVQARAKSYYGILKLQNDNNKSKAFEKYKDVKGESQRVFYLLKNLKTDQLNIIVCRELWKCHMALPNDTIIMRMVTQAFENLSKSRKIEPGYFALKPQVNDTILAKIDSTGMSKYDKIKLAQQDYSKFEPFQMAFLEFAKDQEFLDFFNQFSFGSKDNSSYTSVKHVTTLEEHTFKKAGIGPINNLVICDPYYIRIDNDRISERVFTSYQYEKNYIQLLSKIATNKNMNVSVYDVAAFYADNTEEYNDIQLIDAWHNELSEHDTTLNVSSFQAEINDFSNRVGTPYIGFSGVVADKYVKDKSILAYAIILPVFIPFIAIYALTPAYRIYYFFDVYDSNTGKLVYSEFQIMKSKDQEQFIERMIYKTYSNLSSGYNLK